LNNDIFTYTNCIIYENYETREIPFEVNIFLFPL